MCIFVKCLSFIIKRWYMFKNLYVPLCLNRITNRMTELEEKYLLETKRTAMVDYNRSGYSELYVKWLEQQVKKDLIAGVVKRYLAIGTLGSGKSFRYVDTADTMKCFVEYLNEIYPDFDIDAVIEV